MNTRELRRTPNPPSKISTQTARIALICPLLFILILLLLHVVKKEIDPNWQPISEYGLGNHAYLMILAFFSMGAACFALFLTLRSQTRTVIGKTGFSFLIASATGFLLAGIFRTDASTADDASRTVSGQLHSIGATLGGLIPFAILFITIALVNNSNWRKEKVTLWVIAAIAWIGDLVYTMAMVVYLPENNGRLGPAAPIGWYNRIMIIAFATCILWIALLSMRIKQRQIAG
jgi:hypothetical protein